jgi:hypothetical protein
MPGAKHAYDEIWEFYKIALWAVFGALLKQIPNKKQTNFKQRKQTNLSRPYAEAGRRCSNDCGSPAGKESAAWQ